MYNLDTELHNADWTKIVWELPPYKSEDFYEQLNFMEFTLEEFKRLPVYQYALQEGRIKNDKWVGKSKNKTLADKVFKSSTGAGNWAHEGLSGQWGGSSSTGGSSDKFLAIDPEFRYSFDPDTGQFHPERHMKHEIELAKEVGANKAALYSEDLMAKIGDYEHVKAGEMDVFDFQTDFEDLMAIEDGKKSVQEVLEKYGVEKPERAFAGKPEPDTLVDEKGEIDTEELNEITEGMEFENKYAYKMETVAAATKIKEEEYQEEVDRRLRDVASKEAKITELEDMPASFQEILDEGQFEIKWETVVGDRISETDIFMEPEYRHLVEEVNELQTAGEMKDYLENNIMPEIKKIEATDVNDLPEAEQLDFIEKDIAYSNMKSMLEDQLDVIKLENGIDDKLKKDMLIGREEEGLSVSTDDFMAPEITEEIAAGSEFYEQYTSDKIAFDKEIIAEQIGKRERAYALTGVPKITLAEDTSIKSVIHEMGHCIHRNSGEEVDFAVNEFFEERTAGHELETIYTNSSEMGYTKAFFSEYAGKVYNREPEGKMGEEIFAVGAAEMYKDPEKFKNTDEEHYNLVYGIMKGVF